MSVVGSDMRRLGAACALALVVGTSPGGRAAAQTQGPIAFDIPAEPLGRSLIAFGEQSHQSVVFDPAVVAGLTAPALVGRFTLDEGLHRLLAGSPLHAVRRGGAIVLKAAREASDTGPPAVTAEPPTGATPEELAAGPTNAVSEVVVTGTQIRGASNGASPLVSISRQAMDRAGQGTIAEALSALPQAFGGTSTPQTSLLGADGLGTNFAGSTGVNLRGLGSNSTLVLVDGRRMAGSGFKGDFADVSAVPTAAVDHVEVLLDGASALYGSDAVGGVVNVILRHDFDGGETRVRYAAPTQGGDASPQVSQTYGRTWNGGDLVAAYEYQGQSRLSARERAATADADLTRLGGTDHRLPYSHPGNILALDPDTSAFTPAFAIPQGQNGVGLTPQSFLASAPNLENYRALADVLPDQDRHSLYLHGRQELGPDLRVDVEARYSRRSFDYALPEALDIFQVTAANPHFVSPDGAAQDFVGYAFGDELGAVRNRGTSDNFGVSAGVSWRFGRTWNLDVYADFAEEHDLLRTSRLLNSGYLDEALGNVPDDPSTSFSTAEDGFFNPYGDGGANSRAILDFVGSGVAKNDSLSRVATFNAKADGVVVSLPGGEVRAAVGVQLRRELFKAQNYALTQGTSPYEDGGQTYARSISAAFAELRVPLVGAQNTLPGVAGLELSLAGRIENYEDVGLTGDPKLGLIWTPVSDLKVRASYGTSFRAPALTEVNALQSLGPAFISQGASQVLALVEYGGDKDLKPETATTWTIGADYRPRAIKGLTLNLTWFDIDYDDRIGHPGSITTIHADSAALAFEQLTLLVRESEGGRDLPRSDVRDLLTLLVDVVVQLKRVDGRFRMTELHYEPLRKRRVSDLL